MRARPVDYLIIKRISLVCRNSDGRRTASDEKKDENMKKSALLIALTLALTVALPARAQSGCADSPENPTLVLAGLAGGAFVVSSLRTRLSARHSSKK
jgi:XrtJ-associated TM-motif-TM protein